MPTKDEVPLLGAEQASLILCDNDNQGLTEDETLALKAIASGRHIVIRNPAGLIEKWKAHAKECRDDAYDCAQELGPGSEKTLDCTDRAEAVEMCLADLAALIAGAGDE